MFYAVNVCSDLPRYSPYTLLMIFFFFHFESSFSGYSPLAWNMSSGIAFTGSVFEASIYIFYLSKNKLINFFSRGLHLLCEDSPAPRLWTCYSTRFSETLIDLLLTLNSKPTWSWFLCEVWGRGLCQPLVFSNLTFVVVVEALKSCLTLFDPMNCSTPGFPVLHYLLEFAQTHVQWVGDAIQPSHPLLPPSPPAFKLSQHQGLCRWVSSSHQVAKGLELQLNCQVQHLNVVKCFTLLHLHQCNFVPALSVLHHD